MDKQLLVDMLGLSYYNKESDVVYKLTLKIATDFELLEKVEYAQFVKSNVYNDVDIRLIEQCFNFILKI
tara:strand:- start:550 stop:756 length:207 start_codon:yes stop_codon:yes gene_type:complete